MTRNSIVTICLFTCLAALAAKPGKLVVEPPTLRSVGFHWEVSGASDEASAKIEYRKAGEGNWRQGMGFMKFSLDGVDFVAGSLFYLAPGTEYEARLTLVDPKGVEGEPTQTVTFTTRTEPELPSGGTTYHVYPPNYAKQKEQPQLPDWRRALADDQNSPLKPGDIVALHAGTYELATNLEAVKTRSIAEAATAKNRSMPQGGATWHVYPTDHKGKKEQPTIKLNHYETPILRKDRKGRQEVKPGDTVLFHAGTYKVDKTNYRDRLFQGPKWGVWWFWGGGKPGKPVVFKAAGDGEVVFDGDGNYGIFQLAATDHMWIDGLTFRNAQCAFLAGMDGLAECEGLSITNCTFTDIGMPVYADTPTKDWYIADNKGLDVIHAGPWHEAFGVIDVRVDGQPGKPIVIRSAGDGEVMIEGGDRYAMFDTTHANHVWIKDIKLRNTECAVLTGLYPFGRAPHGLIVTGLDGENVRMGVYGDESTAENWYITDNRFIGRANGTMGMNNHTSPFGINVCGRGHVVAYNHLEWFQDGIDLGWWDRSTSYQKNDFTASVDVHNNYVFGSGDNSLEADGSYFNGRFFDNAFLTCNSPSTQSTPGGPYYFIRNLFYCDGGGWKLPRAIISLHNLYTSPHQLSRHRSNTNRFLNNLYVVAPARLRRPPVAIVSSKEPQSGAYSDYNGLRLVPKAQEERPFVMGKDKAFATLAEYAKSTGLEQHSVIIPGFDELFVNVPEPEKEKRYPLDGLDFRLKPDTPAIDAGVVIPNINEDFSGKAPDLGPIEHGKPMPQYGPRRGGTK